METKDLENGIRMAMARSFVEKLLSMLRTLRRRLRLRLRRISVLTT
jgi:hypothetical protein